MDPRPIMSDCTCARATPRACRTCETAGRVDPAVDLTPTAQVARRRWRAVGTLSGCWSQGVATARAVSRGRRMVIMDEPTAALDVRESAMMPDLSRSVRQRGVPVVVINHGLQQVFELTDRTTVTRLGRHVGITLPDRHGKDDVVAMITGARIGR
jgi:fructose transport system ATP-binding protein